ncbi:MAG: hypothetical protein HC892_22845 [Saprospiraceae bacterium]|nr:hypothetical protein [Saprospiraceae bacterium]
MGGQSENISTYQIFDTHDNKVSELKALFPKLPFAENNIHYINHLHHGFLFTLYSGKKYFLLSQKGMDSD